MPLSQDETILKIKSNLQPSTSLSTLTANTPHSLPMASTSDTRLIQNPVPSNLRELRPLKNVSYEELYLGRAQFLTQCKLARNSVGSSVTKVRKRAVVAFPVI